MTRPVDPVFLRQPHAAYRAIADRVAIVDTVANRIIRLNETGSSVWRMLDGRGLGEVSARIAREFAVDPAAVERDVLRFVGVLRDRGLVREVP